MYFKNYLYFDECLSILTLLIEKIRNIKEILRNLKKIKEIYYEMSSIQEKLHTIFHNNEGRNENTNEYI